MRNPPRIATVVLVLIAACLMVASPVMGTHATTTVSSALSAAPAAAAPKTSSSTPATSGLAAELRADGPSHFVPGAPAALSSAQSSLSHVSNPSTSLAPTLSAQAMVRGAAKSLESGAGPAHGAPWSCRSPSAESLSCAAPDTGMPSRAPAHVATGAEKPLGAAQRTSSAAVSPDYSGQPAWYNQTDYMNFGGPGPMFINASAAYYPPLDQVVLFGGCDPFGECPSNATWIYNGYAWFNETDFIFGDVPAAMGAGLVWDPAYSLIFMVAGVDDTYNVTNWTWAYDGYGWFNLTNILGPAGAIYGTDLNGTAYASLAWDPALGVAVLVDGCLLWYCGNVYNQYWVLTDYGWLDEGTIDGLGEWSYLYGTQMAFDANDQEMVLFGGISYFTGDYGPSAAVNETLTYDGDWSNVTTTSEGCYDIFVEICFYPGARAFGATTWDGQIDALVMEGGIGPTGIDNDTWYFVDGAWYPSDFFASLPGPGIESGAMPTNSSTIAPILASGLCYALCLNYSYVFEAPPSLSINHVLPDPTEAGVALNLSISNGLGDGSGPNYSLWLGDNQGHLSFQSVDNVNFTTNAFTAERSLVETEPGDIYVWAETWDWFGVYNYTEQLAVVNVSLAATATATPTVTELGHAIDFLATASDGVPAGTTYGYLWGFGDGSAESAEAAPSHTYASPGIFDAWANVSDTLTYRNITVPVTVYPDLAATASASKTATDLGLPVTFTGVASEGSGDYTSYAWSFTGGGVGSGASADYTCGAVGTCTGELTVTDSLGFTAEASASVTINADPTGTLTASSTSVHTGTSVTLTATPVGGTGPYTYAWTLPAGFGCAASTSATLSCSAPSTGTYTVSVTMTDAVGKTVTQSLSVTVSKASTTTSFLTSDTGLALIGVVVIIVIAAIALLAMRRRKKPAPGPMTPASPATGPTGTAGGSTTGTPPAGPPPGAS